MEQNNTELESKYLNAQNLVTANKEHINTSILNSKYEHSCKVLVFKAKVIDTLIDSSLEIDAVRSYYTICVLMRSAIENYLVAEYVFTSARTTKTDKNGIAYFNYYYGAELFKRENYNLTLNEKITKTDKEDKQKLLDVLLIKYPELSEILKSNSDIEIAFRYQNLYEPRAIIDYFNNGKTKELIDEMQNIFFKQLVEKYNFLSSYVHGGPTSDMETFNIFTDEKKERKNLEHIAFMKIFYTKTITNLFLLLFESTHDIAYPIFIKQINNELDDIAH